MQEIVNWTIKTIRETKNTDSSWLEENKFEWVPHAISCIKNMINKNYSVLIITDESTEWFKKYILSNINKNTQQRPLLPFYDFAAMYQHINKTNEIEDMKLIEDMLNTSFPNGYLFWYIGDGKNPKSALAKFHAESFLWLIDDEANSAISLQSDDENLDIKLIQLFDLYNKTIDGVLYGKLLL
ncbi:MAG: hypothetical protein B1H07_04995 [Campylobacteraceae bacterium 4484_166]|nr:MAG: hypothetical protein B1H07_04995 [Campylobacteraceae bacterium 4484_166]